MPEMVSHPGAAEIILLEIAGCFLHALEFPKAYRIETACLYSLISCTWAVVAGMACSAAMYLWIDYESPARFTVSYRQVKGIKYP